MDFSLTELLLSLISWSIPVILATVITADPIREFLLNSFGSMIPVGRRKVKGIWLAQFDVVSQGEPKTIRHIVKINQFGSFCFGKSVHGDKPHNKFNGKLLHEQYFTGVWKNSGYADAYSGSFQFFLTPSGDEMNGQWLGYNRENIVQNGQWTWRRLSSATRKADVLQVIEEHPLN